MGVGKSKRGENQTEEGKETAKGGGIDGSGGEGEEEGRKGEVKRLMSYCSFGSKLIYCYTVIIIMIVVLLYIVLISVKLDSPATTQLLLRL